MKNPVVWLAIPLSLSAAAIVRSAQNDERSAVLAFSTMAGVDGAFIQEENALRGIEGDELPWEVAGAKGRLEENGHLVIDVHGLVFANSDIVPVELRGKNDEACFRAVVSSLTEDESGRVVVSNVTTDCFAADEEGNCEINALVKLPEPCIAPIVFVIAGSEAKWFAVTGLESD